jgi:hypothetical protein
MTPEASLYLACAVGGAVFSFGLMLLFDALQAWSRGGRAGWPLYAAPILLLLSAYIVTAAIYRFNDAQQCQNERAQCLIDKAVQTIRCDESKLPPDPHSAFHLYIGPSSATPIDPWPTIWTPPFRRTP